MFVFIVGFAANAKDIYVSQGASGNGSKESPLGTVDEALRSAFSGDVIHVAKGDYVGPGGSGRFVIDKPNLTLVGGYNPDFTERHPFKHLTRLMQAEDHAKAHCRSSPRCNAMILRQKLPQQSSSYSGQPIVKGEKAHANAVLDGFVIDGYTRYKYKPDDELSLRYGPLGTPCVHFTNPGVKIRNSIVINCAGPGIYIAALGTKLERKPTHEPGEDWNEVSNTVILNTLMSNIKIQIGNQGPKNPDGGCALIKNNTLAYNWLYLGEDHNLQQGDHTRLTVLNNVLAYAGYGISNGFGNRFGRYIGNVFYGHAHGAYKYWDKAKSKQTISLQRASLLQGTDCKTKYSCSKQSQGNLDGDPNFKNRDIFFHKRFAMRAVERIDPEGDEENFDEEEIEDKDSEDMGTDNASLKPIFAPVWDPGEDWSTMLLVSQTHPTKGFQFNGIGGVFQAYQSSIKELDLDSITFIEMNWEDLKRGKKGTKLVAQKPKGMFIQTSLQVGNNDSSGYFIPDPTEVTKTNGWICYRDTSHSIFLYAKEGSKQLAAVQQASREKAVLFIQGQAFDLTQKIKSPGRVGIVVLSAELDDDD